MSGLSGQIMNRAQHAIVALAALLLLAAYPSPSLEGRWKLVEQRYGSGQAGRVIIDPPVRLEFFVSGGKLAARIWPALSSSHPMEWPAYLSEHAAHRVEVRQVLIHPGENIARAVYRVKPASSDGDEVEIREEYRLAEEGGALVGTVRVTAIGKEGTAGTYVLQRRFVREP